MSFAIGIAALNSAKEFNDVPESLEFILLIVVAGFVPLIGSIIRSSARKESEETVVSKQLQKYLENYRPSESCTDSDSMQAKKWLESPFKKYLDPDNDEEAEPSGESNGQETSFTEVTIIHDEGVPVTPVSC